MTKRQQRLARAIENLSARDMKDLIVFMRGHSCSVAGSWDIQCALLAFSRKTLIARTEHEQRNVERLRELAEKALTRGIEWYTDEQVKSIEYPDMGYIAAADPATVLALLDSHERLLEALKPFAKIVLESNGRIPTEKLSAANWHKLTEAYAKPIAGEK